MNKLYFSNMVKIFGENVVPESNNESSVISGTEILKSIFKNPVTYIVIGSIIFLVILLYLLKRIIKPKSDKAIVIIRKGCVHRVIDEKSTNYFLIPFVDKVGATIFLGEKEINSDKLYINNGPDALYRINYTLRYKVVDVLEFYKYADGIEDLIVDKLNEGLRKYADSGNALVLIKFYRENEDKIIQTINDIVFKYKVEAVEFKINFVEPLGR